MLQIVLITLLAIILLSLLFILLTPIYIIIDTAAKDFHLRMKGIFKIEFLPDDEKLFTTRVIVFKKVRNIQALKNKAQRQARNIFEKSKKTSSIEVLPKVLNVLRAFRIKKLFVEIDSGDVMLNAWLHPVFYHIGANKKFFHVNYIGQERLFFEAQTRAILVLYQFFKARKK